MFSMWTGLATFSVLCLTFVLIPRGLFNANDDISTSNDWTTLADTVVDDLIRRLRRSASEADPPSLATIRLQFLRLKYPWTIRSHFLPNYITNSHRVQSKSNPTGDLSRERYVDAVKVFVHVPRTSGTSLVECIKSRLLLRNADKMVKNNNGSSGAGVAPMTMAPLMTDSFRTSSWDNPDALGQQQRNRYDVHAGGYSFGVCDSIRQRSCSYFAVLRDPFEQAVSSYRHCRTSLGDPQCNVVNANRVSLRDWIVRLHGGAGLLFGKFLFDGRICNKSVQEIMISRNAADGRMDNELMTSSGHQQDTSCWYKQKLWADTIPEDEKSILLDYVLDNLEQFFAVLGIYEDMDTTLRTLELVYGMPFSECRRRPSTMPPSTSRTDYDDDDRDSKVRFTSDLNNVRPTTDGGEEEEEESLRNDVNVRKALQYDEQIYRRAREIVSLQNRRLFNRLKP